MPTVYLCDFDGTVSPADVGAELVRRFSTAPPEVHRSRLARWRSGSLGHRELTMAECTEMRGSKREALTFARTFTVDPAFEPFVRETQERGDEVMVVSEGFDFYLADRLAAVGLADLSRASNRVRFRGTRWTPEFPFADPACTRCGNCKAQHVRRYRALGFTTVFVGDGLSDRCGAQAADVVFAREGRSLLAWCKREHVRCRSFRDFRDVVRLARRRAGRLEGVA
jgi:2-hydroxy-3-keto-5-methylthiopentenyl-1-phosphate phosphatase